MEDVKADVDHGGVTMDTSESPDKLASLTNEDVSTEKLTPTASEAVSTDKLTPTDSEAVSTDKLTPTASEAVSTDKLTPTASEAVSTDKLTPAASEVVGGSGAADARMKDVAMETKSETRDPYCYTRRSEFTSEVFKIEVSNLPRNFGFGQLKKKFTAHNLNPVKIKAENTKGQIAFVTFRSVKDRDTALKTLNGLVWKSLTLRARIAKPSPDPLLMKRKQRQGQDWEPSEKKARSDKDVDLEEEVSLADRLKNVVTPLWNVPYEEQLQKKFAEMKTVIMNLTRLFERNCPELKSWIKKQKEQYDKRCIELLPIKPSPVLESYRNKCEYTVGKDPEGTDCTVGFRYGRYRGGTSNVGEPDQVNNIPQSMKTVAQSFQNYIRSSAYDSYNPENHQGHWRQLAVRTCWANKDVMAIADFHPQDLGQDKIDEEKNNLKEYFTSGPGSASGVTCFYFRVVSERFTGSSVPYEHVYGEQYIHEELLGMKFRISPDAFFQVNTPAAEELYIVVADWCGVSADSTTLLDVCCGTGTIGLSMAKKVQKVIGVEMCQQAIDDAKFNAALNGITNAEYHCGKAEDVMPTLTKQLRSRDIVAVVDPPRPGLHPRVIHALRRAPFVKRLVYVSCNPTAAVSNIVDLCRAVSKRMKGHPFRPVKAMPVDLFPQTPHCEMVILLERAPESNKIDPPVSQTCAADLPTVEGESKQSATETASENGNKSVNITDSEKLDKVQEHCATEMESKKEESMLASVGTESDKTENQTGVASEMGVMESNTTGTD